MKRILLDVNVVLDVLLDRNPHAEASASAWAAVESGAATGMLAGHGVTTIHYLVQKELGSVKAKRILSTILRVFAVAGVDGAVIQEALQLPCPDFEDAVTAAAARHAGCDCIVTRDPRGFRGSPVQPLTPEAAVPLFGSQ
jgi:predicted nucleic acid-binding protein